MMVKSTYDSAFQEIRNDRTTGAGALARKAAQVVLQTASTLSGEPAAFLQELVQISKVLIETQSSMAPIFHLVNVLLLAAEGKRDQQRMRQAVTAAIEAFVSSLETGIEEISRRSYDLIPDGSRILTHSFSTTVLRVLSDAKVKEKRFDVICTESRPICEGYEMAAKLAEAQIGVQLQIDSAGPYAIRGADLVLVGADCITPLGLVNKVGTYGVALSAEERGIPFYVLCGTEKLLGAGMAKGFRILRKDPKEIWSEAPKGVEVLNFYFDTTPLNFLTAIVTEEGVIRGSDLFNRFEKMKVSPYFPS